MLTIFSKISKKQDLTKNVKDIYKAKQKQKQKTPDINVTILGV